MWAKDAQPTSFTLRKKRNPFKIPFLFLHDRGSLYSHPIMKGLDSSQQSIPRD